MTSSSSKLYLNQVKNLSYIACLLELLSNDSHILCECMLRGLYIYLRNKCGIPASLATPIVCDSIGYIIWCVSRTLLSNLLIHLTVWTKFGWDRTKEELDLRVNDLIIIQTQAQGKVQKIYGIYSYLWDLSNNIWIYIQLREKHCHANKASNRNMYTHCGGSWLIHPLDEVWIWKNVFTSKAEDKKVDKMKGSKVDNFRSADVVFRDLSYRRTLSHILLCSVCWWVFVYWFSLS